MTPASKPLSSAVRWKCRKRVKELRADPWEAPPAHHPEVFKKTPLRLIHGTRSGFAIYPAALHQLDETCMANVGVSEVRISDSWNDPKDWAWRVKQAKNAGLKPIINLIYTLSPRHTDEESSAIVAKNFPSDLRISIHGSNGSIRSTRGSCSKRFSRSNGSNCRVGKQFDNARAEHALRSFEPGWGLWTWPSDLNRHNVTVCNLIKQTSTFPEFWNENMRPPFGMEISLEFRRTAPILRLTGEQPKPAHGACEWVVR